MEERRRQIDVTDAKTEKRALYGNVIASLAVLFLAWISITVTDLAASSKIQERELVNMNKYFTIVLELQQRQIDGHVNNDSIHSYAKGANHGE